MELLNAPFKLAAYKARIEKGGENGDGDTGGTLTLEQRCNADQLSQFFPSAEAFDAFAKAIWTDDGEVRHGICGAIQLEHQIIGGTVTLALPASKKVMQFETADVKDLTVEPGEGHLADVRFKILVHPTEEQGGKLTVPLLGKELGVSAVRKASDEEARKAGQTDLSLAVPRAKKEEQDDAPDSSKTLEEQQAEAAAKEAADPAAPIGQKPPQRPKTAKAH